MANSFDEAGAKKELGLQVEITQNFEQERRKVRTEYAKQSEEYKKQAKELPEGSQERQDLETKAKQIDNNLRVFDGVMSALFAPNAGGAVGDVVRAVSPQVAYHIGQYFKENNQEGSASHLLAHALLGATVSAATGNDVAIGALSGATSEKAAPALATYLFGTNDPEKLTQEQKDTITSIITV